MSDSTQNPPPDDAVPPQQTPPAAPQGGYLPSPESASAPGAAPQAGAGQPADLLPRFLARLVDYILLAVVNGLLVSVVVVGAIMGSTAGGFGFGPGASYAASAVSALFGAVLALGYFAYLESTQGRTVGKMLLKLETRGPDGGRPTMEQAIRRNAFTAIGVIGIVPLIGWFLSPLLSLVAVVTIAVTITNNPQTRRGWHDDFAGGTSVVRVD